jgi:DNA-binding MarR family transcriptional regulator
VTRGPDHPDLAAEAARVAAQLQAIGRVLSRARWEEARHLTVPLTGPQLVVMKTLVEEARLAPERGGLSLSELSERVALAHSTVSGIVARLERRGLVRRRLQADDRRRACIDVTKRVQEWLDHELPTLGLGPLTAAMEQATGAERRAVRAGLDVLERLLRAAP